MKQIGRMMKVLLAMGCLFLAAEVKALDPFLTVMDELTAYFEAGGMTHAQADEVAWAFGFIVSDANMYPNGDNHSPDFADWMATVGAACISHPDLFTSENIGAFIDDKLAEYGMTLPPGAFAEKLAIILQIIENYPEVAEGLSPEELAAFNELVENLGTIGGGIVGSLAELEEAMRREMGGFSPVSAPIQLARNLMGGNLLRGSFSQGGSPYKSSFNTSSSSAYGVQAWAQDWDVDDTDGLNLAVEPYFQANATESVSYSVGLPLFWTTTEKMESDNFWAIGLEGVVRKDFEGGFFAGLHAAGINNYASNLRDNQFITLVGGPFAGYEHLLNERLILTCAVLSEGIYTEKAASTWYVAGGLGLSALVTDKVVAHLNGTYYRSMDTYVKDEDADFFDVGISVDIQMNECSLLNFGISTITGADEVDSITGSIGVCYCF